MNISATRAYAEQPLRGAVAPGRLQLEQHLRAAVGQLARSSSTSTSTLRRVSNFIEQQAFEVDVQAGTGGGLDLKTHISKSHVRRKVGNTPDRHIVVQPDSPRTHQRSPCRKRLLKGTTWRLARSDRGLFHVTLT